MRIAILGGTGALGRGLALRLSKKHEVLIGSRDESKGKEAAKRISQAVGKNITGGLAKDVATLCETAILAISYDPEARLVSSLEGPLAGKLVISPIVPLKVGSGFFAYAAETGSAAEQVASILRESRVAASLHTIPAPLVIKADTPLDMDVLVATDRRETFDEAAGVISSIERLRPLYAGPLSQSRTIEGLTPLLLNLAKLNGLRNLSIKFV